MVSSRHTAAAVHGVGRHTTGALKLSGLQHVLYVGSGVQTTYLYMPWLHACEYCFQIIGLWLCKLIMIVSDRCGLLSISFHYILSGVY